MTPQLEMHIGELDKSIIELSKRKLKLLQEVNDINETISFLRQQQEQLINVCHTAPENKDEGWPYATGFARSAMQGAVEDLQRLM